MVQSPEPPVSQAKGKAILRREFKRLAVEMRTHLDKKMVGAMHTPLDQFDLDSHIRASNILIQKALPRGTSLAEVDIREVAIATVVWKGSGREPISISLWDQESVEELQDLVEELQEEGNIGLRVRCDIEATLAPKPKETSSGRNEQQSQASTNVRGSQRRARAATAQEIGETWGDADVATGNHIPALSIRWQCPDKGCPNYRHPCVPLNGVGHLYLNSDDLIRWNSAIKAFKTSVECLPADISASIQARRTASRKRKGAPGTVELQGQGMVQHFHLAGAGTANAASEPLSSPPIMAGPELDNVKRYVNWLWDTGSITGAMHTLLRSRLEDGGWAFSHLRDISIDEWREMGIPNGTRLVVRSKQKIWIAEEHARAIAALAPGSGSRPGSRSGPGPGDSSPFDIDMLEDS